MAHNNTNKLPTSGGLPTNAEDEEMDKEATDGQERRKEPPEGTPPFRVTNLVDYAVELVREERAAYLANIGRDNRSLDIDHTSDELRFSKTELDDFAARRQDGLAKKSTYWIARASTLLWESTKGEVSSRTLTALRERVLAKYKSAASHSKVLSFAVSFLKFLAKTKMEPRYGSFEAYLEMPKAVKERKSITSRIVTKDDIEHVLGYIKRAENNGNINSKRSAQYSAFVTFGAFTGQRSLATIANLTVGQFRQAAAIQKAGASRRIITRQNPYGSLRATPPAGRLSSSSRSRGPQG